MASLLLKIFYYCCGAFESSSLQLFFIIEHYEKGLKNIFKIPENLFYKTQNSCHGF